MATRALDTVITFRVLKLLTTKWTDQAAYKEGLIDEKGKRIKTIGVDTDQVLAAVRATIKMLNLKIAETSSDSKTNLKIVAR